jgi:hypothetical protein
MSRSCCPLPDEAVEGRFGDDGLRPDAIADLLLGEGPRPLRHEELQEVERLADEGHRLSTAGEEAAFAVE